MNLHTFDNGLTVLRPNWQVPSHVDAIISTRLGGLSHGPYSSLNLGLHVHDDEYCVLQNRSMIQSLLPNSPIWLDQVHGTQVSTPSQRLIQADATITAQPNDVLTIMTADCMPILFCDQVGEILGACHGGWRGLGMGIIEKTIQEMLILKRPDRKQHYLSQIQVYLGPSIGPKHFEVGQEVFDTFIGQDASRVMLESFQALEKPGKYLANLFQIARRQCQQQGLEQIYSEEICTFEHAELFFSHRRDKLSGRFASFLWKTL